MNNSYYVYGTFIEKVRYKFKSKEDAIKFEKYARKECRTSFNWLFYDNDSLREEIETDKDECLGLYDHYNQCQNVAKESFHISKPIKSTSLWNRLQHYIFFFIRLNKIDNWHNYAKKKIWSDYIPFKENKL